MKTDTTRFKKSVVVRALLTAFCGTATMMVATGVAAQTPAPGLQRVEITGSNIRRADVETAAPVQTFTREDIVNSGKGSVAEFLQTLTVDNQGSVPTTFGNGFASGASGISLRGLGVASTLVLINGRRIAPYGLADDGQKIFADLNVIPLEAVERVEILKDGGSAIYGSDAIAGVVNVILRKSYQGTVATASYGASSYHDGAETRASITHGFGDMEEKGFNVLLNLELSSKNAIWNRDRNDRGAVGKGDGRPFGYDAQGGGGTIGGGTGAILANNTAASSIAGNVRNPSTLNYYSRTQQNGVGFTKTFPGADCATLSGGYAQGDPGFAGGQGCLIDGAHSYSQIQPQERNANFFARAAKQLNGTTEAYAELNLYNAKSESSTTPSGISGSVGYPGGPVSNAAVALGASHPDNPYFGSAARLRYVAADLGPRVQNTDDTFTRILLGVKGTWDKWDYDTGFLYSQNKLDNTRNGYLQRDVTFALLNPGNASQVASARANSPAYAALPAGTVWRIAENAGQNSPAVYAALSPTIASAAKSSITQVDFKGSRELGKLEGGPIGIAVGAEYRRESSELTPTTGTDRGNIIGLGYSAFKADRNVLALYGEALFPITKKLEASAALRADHYSDVGTSVTPKVGVKFTPMAGFAIRGTYAEGFRAPGAAENGVGGVAAFSAVSDPLRCALGVASACGAGQVALITTGNPNLKPEKAKNLTLGVVWDVTPSTSLTADLWQIKRSNEINQEQTDAAVAAGHVSRDISTATSIPGDPGGITAVLVNYINSASSTVRGLDVDGKTRFDLGSGNGKLTFKANWTHLFSFKREDVDGSVRDFAGTHGNCDVTNCMGTPADRLTLGATWEMGPWRVAAVSNTRASISNTLFKNDPAGCASAFADGSEAPGGCKLASFTTVDMSLLWKASDKTEVFGVIRNVLNRKPPLDPLTYGAVSYNPLDYSGAVGRFFSVGLRHKF
jgi:iron complex outermembrane receptor protein